MKKFQGILFIFYGQPTFFQIIELPIKIHGFLSILHILKHEVLPWYAFKKRRGRNCCYKGNNISLNNQSF